MEGSLQKANYLPALGFLAATLCAPAALAQTSGDQQAQAEIVVSGQRQAYRGDIALRETPQNIAVIDAELLEEAGITRLAEALDMNASMARQNNFGGLWDNFAVRGFPGDENLPSGYLVNGFNAGRGFGGPRDVAGIERIEILRGPNAALFGRGEPGGSVNLVTKTPEFEFGGSFGFTAGSFETYRGDVDVTGGLTDAIALRGIAFYEDAGSFRDTLDSTRYGVMPSALIRFGDATSLTYELELTRQEIPFDRGVVALNNRLGVVPIQRFLGEPGDGPLKADATGHQVQLQHDFSPAWSVLLGFGQRETDLEGFSTEAELVASRQALFVTGQSLSRQRRFRDYEASHTVWRGELSGRFATGPFEHRVLIGADHDTFENSQVFLRFRPPAVASQTTPAAGNIINIFTPIYGAIPLPTPGPQTNRLDEQEAWGVYVQDQIRLSNQLQVRIGGRYDDFSADSLNRTSSARTGFSDTKFSPQAGVVFDLTDAVTLYATYGQGFRPNSGADFAGRPFAPEESESSEVGVKFTLLDGALTGTAAAFSMTKTNVLTADPVNSGFSIAIGEAESQGLEFDLSGELPGDIDVWMSYAYVDAQISKNALDVNFAGLIRAGDRLINVPDHSLSVMASKDFEFAGRELELGAGVQYVGDRLGETATTFELPSYTTLRLFGDYELTDAIELAFEINNVTDEEFYTNSFHRLWVAPGAPRNASVSLRYAF
jgi:iron complex outermembrane receptor protein